MMVEGPATADIGGVWGSYEAGAGAAGSCQVRGEVRFVEEGEEPGGERDSDDL
jgi:hypothetical protein